MQTSVQLVVRQLISVPVAAAKRRRPALAA